MDVDWDLFRTFESVARLGSFTAAGKSLRISQSTVSRQMNRLEHLAGSPLMLRNSPVQLTARGDALLISMQPMLAAALDAQSALQESPEISGTVRIATVGEIVRWVLVSQLPSFYQQHPQLRLELLASNQLASLAAGEADIALRFARPIRGDLVSQRLITATYGFFVAEGLPPESGMPWLGLAGSLAMLADQRYARQAFAPHPPRLLVEDLESLAYAVRGGLGVALLPHTLASRVGAMVEVSASCIGVNMPQAVPTQDLWLVMHRAVQRLPHIRAVRDWLCQAVIESEPKD